MNRATRALSQFTQPIRSGLEPTDRRPYLSPERSAELAEQLRQLEEARQAAAVEVRDRWVR